MTRELPWYASESNDTASEEVSRKEPRYKVTEIGNCMVAQESPHHDKAKQGEKIRRNRSLAVPSGLSPKRGGGQSSAALEWLQPSHDWIFGRPNINVWNIERRITFVSPRWLSLWIVLAEDSSLDVH